MINKNENQTIFKNLFNLDVWLKKKDYKFYTLNYTPSFNFIDFISNKIAFIGILWRQFFRISPKNIRNIFGLSSKIVDPQATIILATAYLELVKSNKNKDFEESFQICIERVKKLRSSKSKYFTVKQGKKMQLKYYRTSKEDIAPILTVWAGDLFLNAYEYYKIDEYYELANEIKNYFKYEHPNEALSEGVYFYYSPSGGFKIWNASCEISSFLIKTGAIFSDAEAYDLGVKGMNLIINKQSGDGSWFYGETKITNYIDNFHTAFMLRAIIDSLKYVRSKELERSLSKGLEYYKSSFFIDRGKNQIQPRHFIKKHIPLNSNIIQKTDIRDCALSIILFSELSSIKNSLEHIELATYIFNWTNENMFKDRTYYAEKTWLWTNKIPYIDFQAWMLLAIAKYLSTNNLESNE